MFLSPTRRNLVKALALVPAAGAVTGAFAQFRVEITGVGATQFPVAVARFKDEDKASSFANAALSAIVRADLERSGAFRIQATDALLDERAHPNLLDWRSKGADSLVGGSVSRLSDGRFDVRFKLWDAVRNQEVGGLAFAVPAADLRLAAHKIADYVYEKLTGERGVFSTRIAYVTKAGGRYTLRITDADGEGGQVALASNEPIISPAWSPDGKDLAYVSFETQKAVVWLQDVASGARKPIAAFRGSNSAPTFTPDGQQIVLTLSRDGGSQLFMISRDGGNPRRLTSSHSIDTEPCFSPDGKQLYFVSDRGGSPQIYRMPASGGSAERVTFKSSYAISPSISPDGKTMAYISREGGAFKLAVMDLPSSTVSLLTDTSDDESPSFSPTGKLIIYASRAAGRDVLMTTTLDGRIKTRLLSSGMDVREPTWGPSLR